MFSPELTDSRTKLPSSFGSVRMNKETAAYLGGALAIASLAALVASRRAKVQRRKVGNLVRPNIASLQPYRCARDDYEEGILLDANENSIGATLGKLPDERDLNRYPCPYQKELKEKVAAYRCTYVTIQNRCVQLQLLSFNLFVFLWGHFDEFGTLHSQDSPRVFL